MHAPNRPSNKWLLIPILIAVSAIAIVILASMYFAPTITNPSGYYWFPFPFFPLIFIPILFLIFFGLRWFFWGAFGWCRGCYYGQYYDPAMTTLRERFAKGEITKEQFEQIARELEQQ